MKVNGKLVRGIIFDLDGTILDSASIWKEVDEAFFRKRNIEMPIDYGEEIGHIGLDKAATYTINRFHLNEKKEDIIKEWKDGVLDYYAHKVTLKPHVKEFLLFLKNNNVPFCVATANDEDCYKSALINNGIYDLFDFILEVNNFKNGKDKPDIFYACIEKLGSTVSTTIVFEDLPLPLSTAKQANIMCVGVKDLSYNDDIESIKKELADIYIEDFDELYKYISD
mgnify:CR=1 FL=1